MKLQHTLANVTSFRLLLNTLAFFRLVHASIDYLQILTSSIIVFRNSKQTPKIDIVSVDTTDPYYWWLSLPTS